MARGERSIVVGTAGHIDHGKTTLVRALTGTDTDRLPEERRRGITIELGFAPWVIAPGVHASIVDVPGHEAFVRTMVAGAGGIDLLLLVVSAEDGVMPQTREHLHVCELLGIEHAVVALSKVDTIDGDEDMIAMLADDIRAELAATPYAEAPIVPCSGSTGEGLDELSRVVKKAVSTLARRDASGSAILPLDRVFTMKGHGTVVTGTLLAGALDVERSPGATLIPAGERRDEVVVRLRGLQVRNEQVPRVRAGSRVALNLGGVEVSDLARGDVIATGTRVARRGVVHARLRHLAHDAAPWRRDATFQICAGTTNVVGRIDPIDGELPAGDEGLARIRLEHPIPVWWGQRIVLRAFTDPAELGGAAAHGKTVGGGMVIDPDPGGGRGRRPRWRELGIRLSDPDPVARLRALVVDAAESGISAGDLAFRAGVEDVAAALADTDGIVRLEGDLFVDDARPGALERRALAELERFHDEHAMQAGMPRAALEASLGPRVAAPVAARAIDGLVREGRIAALADAGAVAIPGRGAGADGTLPPDAKRILTVYEEAGVAPPTLKDVEASTRLASRRVLESVTLLQRTGKLVRVASDLSMTRPAHDELVGRVREHLTAHGEIDVQALKAMTGLSRKYAVPFLEHLDHEGITRRVGDKRVPGPRA